MTGKKFDDGKHQWHLMPWRELEDVLSVLEHGAEKYGPENWKEVEDFEQRYLDAMQRHLTELHKGYRLDAESGQWHAAHIACNALFLLWKVRNL